jgi:hypothetical protein
MVRGLLMHHHRAPAASLGLRGAFGLIAHAHHGDARLRDLTIRERQRRCDGGQGEIAVAARYLREAPAGGGRQLRESDFGHQLIFGEVDRERAEEEVARRGGSPERRRHDLDFGIKEERDHRQLGGRIGVRQTSAERAAIADCEMRDALHGGAQHREMPGDDRRRLGRMMARERADANGVLVLRDESEPGNPVDVDEDRRPQQAEIEHRHEALPARQDLGVGAHLCERGNGSLDALRHHVVEGRRLHLSNP